MSSEADPHADADGYVQRAGLLAELGRYDEAAAELGFALALSPGGGAASVLLARVHLAAGRPTDALAAADAALAAAPADPAVLVTRAFALIDLRRFGEAAQVADTLLAAGPADAYAQRSAAAILAEARNGQSALNAAWRSVELGPADAQNHLVLGLVSARLGLFDLAERGYREALRLDPELADVTSDVGVMRLEPRRYSLALAELAETAALLPPPPPPPPAVAPTPPVSPGSPAGPGVPPPGVPGRSAGGPPVGRHPVAEGLRQLVGYGAGYAIAATVLVACLAAGNAAISRLFAALAAVAGFVLLWSVGRRLPGLLGTLLPELMRRDRGLGLSIYAVLAGPGLVLLYALVGTPWPLVLAIAASAIAQLVVLRRPMPPPIS